MKFLKSLFAVVFVISTVTFSGTFTEAAPATPGVAEEQPLTGYANNKRPFVAAGAGKVYVAWGNTNLAQFAERDEEAGGAFTYATLGSVGSNPTYYNAVVDVGSDGTVHYAWIEEANRIWYRRRAPGQGFSTPVVIASGYQFAHYPSIAVQGSDNVFVSWRTGSDIEYVRSTNAGQTWSAATAVRIAAYGRQPQLAAGVSGIYLTWTHERDGNVYVGVWNGTNFTPEPVSDGQDYEPDIAVGPDGAVHVAWRRIGVGVFHAVRQSNGSYAITGEFEDPSVDSAVGIAVDSGNNAHVAWISRKLGTYDTWYTIQKAGEAFSNPIAVSNDAGAFKANVQIDASVRGARSVAHLVWESFSGGPSIRYARVQSETCPTPAPATPGPSLANRIYLPMVMQSGAC